MGSKSRFINQSYNKIGKSSLFQYNFKIQICLHLNIMKINVFFTINFLRIFLIKTFKLVTQVQLDLCISSIMSLI